VAGKIKSSNPLRTVVTECNSCSEVVIDKPVILIGRALNSQADFRLITTSHVVSIKELESNKIEFKTETGSVYHLTTIFEEGDEIH
jgi:hypothetical protein